MLALMIINSVASVLFLTGIVNITSFPGLYVVFPLAAVFYGMFLICWMLQKIAAESDAEARAHHDPAVPTEHPHNVQSLHNHDHHESIAA
jgi:ABC-type nickel/cobalt efflux system permease component RcnA